MPLIRKENQVCNIIQTYSHSTSNPGNGLFELLCIFWLVCKQEYTKTTKWISMKLGCRIGLCREKTPFTFSVVLDKGTDSELSLTLPHGS